MATTLVILLLQHNMNSCHEYLYSIKYDNSLSCMSQIVQQGMNLQEWQRKIV